ncbi:MAG: hypothetical protein J1G30_05575, partial [Spirochaetales bacterium]|nr:hypothetical protein [Spirochaetales bacterium]
MKRILFTITSLFFAAAVFSQEAIQSLVVITDSKNLTGSESAWLPENICDKLESNFKAYTSYKMISSKDKAIRDYQKKSETAGFDENTAIEVGKMVSASHIILLTVSKAGKIYSVTAEVVNSTTGVSIAKHMESGQSTIEELFSTVGCAVDEITVKLCDQLGEPLTPTQKYVLIYGDTNISDSEKLAMFNQEITNY